MQKKGKGLEEKIIDYGTKGALIGVLLLIGNRLLKKANQRNTELQVTSDPSVKHAMLLHSAMNPSGLDWLFNYDGTTEESIFQVAAEITDFAAVQKAYANLYKGDSLLADLQAELNIGDYNKFLSLLSSGAKSGNMLATGKGKTKVQNTYHNVYNTSAGDVQSGFKHNKFGTPLYANNLNKSYGQVFEKPDLKPKTLYTQMKRGGLLGKLTKKHVLKIIRNGQDAYDRWYQVNNIPGQNPNKLGYVREADIK